MSSFLSRKKKPEKYELKSKGDDISKDNYGSVTSLVNNEVRHVLDCNFAEQVGFSTIFSILIKFWPWCVYSLSADFLLL